MIDYNIADSFLSHFPGDTIFIAMKDDNSQAPTHFHKSFDKCKAALKKRNTEANNGVFFTVNSLDRSKDSGRHRTSKMWERSRAVFMDDDNIREKARTDFPLIPNLVVNTSEGKFHYYWLIAGGTDDLEGWKQVQSQIIADYDGDKNAKDLTRYLRLPGFQHNKKQGYDVAYLDNGIDPYEWEEIKDAFKSVGGSSTDSNPSTGSKISSGTNSTIEEARNSIITGADFHGNLVSLSYQYAKEGMKQAYIVEYLEGLMDQVSEDLRDERWFSRRADIERIVNGAFDSINETNISLDGFKESQSEYSGEDIPWPPGQLGVLANDAYDMALYQYKEVALVSAIGLLAGICGRKFNVSNTGLNVYLTLLMKTGMGKDSIGKFINRTLNGLNEMGGGSSFVGPKRFTGPKAVINSLTDARSQVCVFTEAGILMRAQSGDQDGLTRLLLGLYGESGHDDFSGVEEFSSNDGRIISLRAPALTIISEATPETLLDVLRDSGALENGHLPRQSIFRLDGKKPYANKKQKKNITVSVGDRLRQLVKKCSEIQAGDKFDVWDFEFSADIIDDVDKFMEECVDMENGHKHEDSIKSIMASRMWLKAAKYAGLASALNHTKLVIKREEWEWAKKLVLFEFQSVDGLFAGSGFNNILEDLSRLTVAPIIVKLITVGYKDPKKQLSKLQIQNQHVPYYKLNQALKNCRALKFDDRYVSTASDGLRKVLDYMVSAGYLDIINNDSAVSSDPKVLVGRGQHKAIYKPTKLFEILSS